MLKGRFHALSITLYKAYTMVEDKIALLKSEHGIRVEMGRYIDASLYRDTLRP